MAQLKQISMGITPNYAPKKTVGEGLANLLITSADAAIKYQDIQDKQQKKLETEQKEKDSNTMTFLQSKIYDGYNSGKFKSIAEAEDFMRNKIKEDPDYIDRYGNKGVDEIFNHKDSIDSWRYASAKLVKEMGKTPEEMEAYKRKLQEADDAIIWNDYVSNRDTRRTKSNYDNLDFQGKKNFIAEELKMIEQESILNGFASDKFKQKKIELLNENKRLYSELGYSADKKIVADTSTNIINSYVKNSKHMTNDVLDDTLASLNELMPPNEQITKSAFYSQIADAVNYELKANEQKYVGLDREQLVEKFPVLSEVKDPKNKSIIDETLNSINAKTLVKREADGVLSGQNFYSNSTKDAQKEVNKSLTTALDNAIKTEDKDLFNQSIAFATENNLKVDLAETNASAFLDYLDSEQATTAIEAGFAKYKNISMFQESKYKIRNKEAAKAIKELYDIAKTNNYDLNSEEGFRDAVIHRNMKKEKIKVSGGLGKKERDGLYTDVQNYVDSQTSAGFLTPIKNATYAFRFWNDQAFGVSSSGQKAIADMAHDNMVMLDMDKEEAIEKAYKDFDNMFKDTGGTDLRDIGVYTKTDYNMFTNVLAHEKNLRVDTIDIFGEVAHVTFKDPSSNEFKEEKYTLNDLVAKNKRAKDAVNFKAIHSKDVGSQAGGKVEGGMNALDLAMAGDGIYTNKDFNDTVIQSIKDPIAYYTKDLEVGQSMEITPKMFNAYYGIEGYDEFKESPATNYAFIKMGGDRGKAYNTHAIAGKVTVTKTPEGEIVLDGQTTKYDFTTSDMGVIGKAASVFVNDSNSKYVSLSFDKKQLGKTRHRTNSKLKNAERISNETGIPLQTVLRTGLYDVKSKKFEKEIAEIYKRMISENESDVVSDTEQIGGVLSVLKNKYGNMFEFRNANYGFGKRAIEFINRH